MKLSDFRKQLPFLVQDNMTVFYSMRMLKKYTLDFDVYLPSIGKNLQRPFVWTLEQKQALILSVLKGMHIPNISIIIVDHKVYQIIDGKQRLSTIMAFIDNLFPFNCNGVDYYYKDMPSDVQNAILGLPLKFNVAYSFEEAPIADQDKIQWFEAINFAGTALDKEHLKTLKG